MAGGIKMARQEDVEFISLHKYIKNYIYKWNNSHMALVEDFRHLKGQDKIFLQ